MIFVGIFRESFGAHMPCWHVSSRAEGAFSRSATYAIVDFRVSAAKNWRASLGDLEPEFELGAAELGSGVLGRCGNGMERCFWRVGFDVLPRHVGKEEAF